MDTQKLLREDKEYAFGFQSNIAMAFIDAEQQYRDKHNKRYLNRNDKHVIANQAAKQFIKNLTR